MSPVNWMIFFVLSTCLFETLLTENNVLRNPMLIIYYEIVCHLCNTLTLFTPGSPWMPEEIKTHVVAHFVGNFRSKNAYKLYINTKNLHWSLFTAICFYFPGLLLSFDSPVALIFKPIANLLLYGWIVSTTGQFTCNIRGPSTYSQP